MELTRPIRESLSDVKLNLAVSQVKAIDWSKCSSEKADNIKRKVRAIMNPASDIDEDYLDVVNYYIEAYIKGLEILNILRISYTEVYEDIYMLEQACKRDVSIKTKMNTDSSMNMQLFNQILDDFEDRLKRSLVYFNTASIMELKHDLTSSWLADCSMQFRSR